MIITATATAAPIENPALIGTANGVGQQQSNSKINNSISKINDHMQEWH